VSRAWYRVALAAPHGAPTLVVAPGEHLGAALATAASRFKDAWPLAVAPAPPDEVPLGESVGKGVVVDKGAAVELPASVMRWPSGVIPSLAVPAHRLTAIQPGWITHPDPALTVIEAQVGAGGLTDLFMGLVERLPVADNLEVRVLDHHDGVGGEEIWLSPRLDVKKAIRFLDDHDVELVENGHVELSIYLRGEKSTLRLTEHKTVVWLSADATTAARTAGWLAELGIPPARELVTLGDVAHFHYRPARASTRTRLIARLASMKLRRVSP
jgi:hypothetical protein